MSWPGVPPAAAQLVRLARLALAVAWALPPALSEAPVALPPEPLAWRNHWWYRPPGAAMIDQGPELTIAVRFLYRLES